MIPSQINNEKEKIIKLSLSFKIRNSDDSSFNYKESDVFTVKHDTSEERSFYCRTQSNNKIITIIKQMELQQGCYILFLARKSKNKYYELIWPIAKFDILDLYNLKNLDYKMWYLVKAEEEKPLYENENEDYYLSENDIIRFGQRKYEVIKLNIISKDNSVTNPVSEKNEKFGSVFYLPEITVRPSSEKIKNIEKGKNEQVQVGYNPETDCRICYGPKSDKENPIIKICKCNTYIHYKCLKTFLKQNEKLLESEDKNISTYHWENFSCEVCEEPYPLKFRIGSDETYCLVDKLEPPENTNYMILESLTQIDISQKEKKKKNIKNIFVVKLTDREIKIGRSETSDIIDADLSISRDHAILKFDKNTGKVKVIGKGRFGTLILIKKNLKLEVGKKIYLQIGNTYVKAEVKEDELKEEEESKNEGNTEETNSKRIKTTEDSSNSNTMVANWNNF